MYVYSDGCMITRYMIRLWKPRSTDLHRERGKTEQKTVYEERFMKRYESSRNGEYVTRQSSFSRLFFEC